MDMKRSVALVINHPSDAGRFLAVRRPEDDPELPGLWGLPAASLQPGEAADSAVLRAAREKLGVQVKSSRVLARGSQIRPSYTLEMTLCEVTLVDAAHNNGPALPAIRGPYPQGIEGLALPIPPASAEHTHYTACRWAAPSILEDGAQQGSLCCRLMLAEFARTQTWKSYSDAPLRRVEPSTKVQP